MKIKNVVCAPGRTGFYFDDQRAIKRGAGHDGMFYIGQPVTEGFSAVRQAGEAISVMLILEDGQVAYGDCAAVQYSGAGGRDPLFLAKDFIPIIEQYIKPCLVGQEADNFRALAARMEAIEVGGKRLHTAIRYGVSQALLDAVAKASGRMMCEVVADEYGCTVSDHLIPIFTQSGDDRYDNADKMIIKGAQVLPHALINNVETKLGAHGEKLDIFERIAPFVSDQLNIDAAPVQLRGQPRERLHLRFTVTVAVHRSFDPQVERLCGLLQDRQIIRHGCIVMIAEGCADRTVDIDMQDRGIVLVQTLR